MKNNNFQIKKTTAVISMLVLGILSIIFAIRGWIDLTDSTYGVIGLAIGIMLLSEIGFKRLTKFSKLKEIGNQQKISLIVALIVIITGIFLLFGIEVPILSDIANGSFLTGGAFIILEAITF
jgi:hypothetical protein